MFIFSRKGSAAILIGIGLLLSIFVSSKSDDDDDNDDDDDDTLTCFHCHGAEDDCADGKGLVSEEECSEGAIGCFRKITVKDTFFTTTKSCDYRNGYPENGCQPGNGKNDPKFKEKTEVCGCSTDLCNSDDLSEIKKKRKEEGVSTTEGGGATERGESTTEDADEEGDTEEGSTDGGSSLNFPFTCGYSVVVLGVMFIAY